MEIDEKARRMNQEHSKVTPEMTRYSVWAFTKPHNPESERYVGLSEGGLYLFDGAHTFSSEQVGRLRELCDMALAELDKLAGERKVFIAELERRTLVSRARLADRRDHRAHRRDAREDAGDLRAGPHVQAQCHDLIPWGQERPRAALKALEYDPHIRMERGARGTAVYVWDPAD
jgi:hypothetical protein